MTENIDRFLRLDEVLHITGLSSARFIAGSRTEHFHSKSE